MLSSDPPPRAPHPQRRVCPVEGLAGPREAGRGGGSGVRRGERCGGGRQATGAGGELQPEAAGVRGAEQGEVATPGGAGHILRPRPVPRPSSSPVRYSVRGESVRSDR